MPIDRPHRQRKNAPPERHAFVFAVSALVLAGAAHAQEAPGVEISTASATSRTPVSYDAAVFAPFSPRTALDMVRRAPGFTLDGGDGRRGFSGAVGNVLIDGRRPAAKSQSPEEILGRIPADQVLRIEVLRGSDTVGDASGQPVLVNVVRTAGGGSGVYETSVEITSRGASPQGALSYSGRRGEFEFDLGGSFFSHYRELRGWRRRYDAAGVLTSFAHTPSRRDQVGASVNGGIAFPIAQGRFSATAQIDWDNADIDSGIFAFDWSGATQDSLSTLLEEREHSYEIGLNYGSELGPWSFTLIGMIDRSRERSNETGAAFDPTGAVHVSYRQNVVQDRGETIARVALARSLGQRSRVEVGGELAFNTLDQALDFSADPPAPAIPNANVLVEEERAEFFAAHTSRIDESWSLETRLAWESSTLDFAGDANQTRGFSYWKPSLQLSRAFGASQLRFRLYRDVGQLDFDQFVSAASVTDALIVGGNPDLAPQTSWVGEAGFDLRFPDEVALSLTLSHQRISDVADLVLLTIADPPGLDIRFDAPGNIGDGEMTTLSLNYSTPVAFVRGARLTLEGYLRDSEVIDPVTGQPRVISNTLSSEVALGFRQDLTDWRFAWGVDIYKEGESNAFRFDEIDTSEEGLWIDVFFETTALPHNMKISVWAVAAFNAETRRERTSFASDRNGSLLRRDRREQRHDSAPWAFVTLSGAF